MPTTTAPDIHQTPHLEIIAHSLQGARNPRNEDHYLCLPALGVFALADGMGGRGHGDVASQLALNSLQMALQALAKRPLQESHLLAAIQVANHRVYERSRQDLQVRGMGTTLVVVWINGTQLHCFHMGDSRVYRLRDFFLKQITTDHSAPLHMIEQGKAKPGAITRAIGVKATIEVDILHESWQPDDLLLMVTDGISDPVPNYQINNILVKPAKQCSDYVHELLQASEQHGGNDDKTLILIRGLAPPH